MKPAEKIKIELIEYIIKNSFENYTHSSLLMEEMPFLCRTRFADMTLIHDKMISFEIKSHADSLAKLARQLADYTKVFDKVYVVLDKRFYNKIKSLDNKIGVFIYDKDKQELTLKRKAGSQRLTKRNLSLLICKKYYDIKNKSKLSLDDIRVLELKNRSKKELKSKVIKSICNKYHNNEYNLADSIF